MEETKCCTECGEEQLWPHPIGEICDSCSNRYTRYIESRYNRCLDDLAVVLEDAIHLSEKIPDSKSTLATLLYDMLDERTRKELMTEMIEWTKNDRDEVL